MKSLLKICLATLLILQSCESSVVVDYDTVKAKKVILKSNDGNEYLLSVINDSIGNPQLIISKVE